MLRRFHFLTLDKTLVRDRPNSAAYQERLFSRPAFKRALVDWEHPLRQIVFPMICKKLMHRPAKF